jgi:ABC-type transport system involved in multi-copper enzyme maturation permease subunit
MMWLTWRQFRVHAIVAGAVLAVLAVLLAVTGLHLAYLYNTSGIPSCHASSDCGALVTDFINRLKAGGVYNLLFFAGLGVLFAVPGLLGVFWGAPLVTREIEAGTFRLAWNQSITRARWLAVKLGLIGLAAMATTGLLTLMITWWASPIDRTLAMSSSDGAVAFSRISPVMFGARGIAPIGYAAFAFALGVTAGVIIRRTIPAMAVTLAGFAFVQIAMPNWIRPHLITPLRTTSALNPANIKSLMLDNNNSMTVLASVSKPGAWILSNQTIDRVGHVFTGPAPTACLSNTHSFQACQASLGSLHLRQLVIYQPASRFWPLQSYETAIFVVLAAALAGFCAWWISRRRLA